MWHMPRRLRVGTTAQQRLIDSSDLRALLRDGLVEQGALQRHARLRHTDLVGRAYSRRFDCTRIRDAGLPRVHPRGKRAPARELQRRRHPFTLEPLAIRLSQCRIELDLCLPCAPDVAIVYVNRFHATYVRRLYDLHLPRRYELPGSHPAR
jgi:hypothetical protein